MNCFNCGEVIKSGEIHGYICKECMNAIEEEQTRIRHEADETEEESYWKPLSPREAILAMLDGATLITVKGSKVKWEESKSAFVDEEERFRYCFENFNYQSSKPKIRPMDTFECIAWAASNESRGWVVSRKYIGNDFWEDWVVPQWFKYDGKEEYGGPGVVFYRRAKVLHDNSGIDESTIQGFHVEVV